MSEADDVAIWIDSEMTPEELKELGLTPVDLFERIRNLANATVALAESTTLPLADRLELTIMNQKRIAEIATPDPSSAVPAPEDTQKTLAELESLVVELEREGDEDYWSYREWKAAFDELLVRLRSQLERITGEQEKISRALTDSGIGGIFDVFENPADAITQMGLYIKELESRRSSDSEIGDTK